VEKPTREMKVNDAKATAASTDHDPLEKGLSKSVILRTRKLSAALLLAGVAGQAAPLVQVGFYSEAY